MKIIMLVSFLFLCACHSTTDQLIQETLDSACNKEIREELEKAIEKQRAVLTEKQLINSLMNMKANMKCD